MGIPEITPVLDREKNVGKELVIETLEGAKNAAEPAHHVFVEREVERGLDEERAERAVLGPPQR